MGKRLLTKYILLLNLFVILGGASCTADLSPSPTEVAGAPSQLYRWKVRLPGKAGIYNEGLIGLPVVNNKVLFHSTIFTSENQEDNRIHALDPATGKLIWTFPETYNPLEQYYFEGKPYIHENVLVTKMSAFEPYTNHDRIVIINANSGTKQLTLHMPREMSRFSCRDIAGNGSEAWFIQEDSRCSYLYKLSLTTGDTTRVLTLHPTHSDGRLEVTSRELHLNAYNGKRVICMGIAEYQGVSSVLQVLLVDADSGEIVFRRTVNRDLDFIVNAVVSTPDYLLYTCGRNAGCFEINTQQKIWEYQAGGSVDRMIPGLHVQDTIAIAWGHTGYTGISLHTGRVLYEKEMPCVSINGRSPCFFIVRGDGKLSVVHQKSGNEIRQLSVNSHTDRSGFSYSCKPGVSGNSLFLFGEYNAYCYNIDVITK